ncbi:major facilitator superfamily domain-containing protein [Diaporthe sp. PMI_573]|nr:major facilitator superfamily domain-containing protein [Diaporthaceae sp. PMI_573]
MSRHSFMRKTTLRPYTVFTKGQKRFISLVASFAAMFSTLMSYIYYPALVPMSRSLGVSVTLINLTVTSYLIVAAIAPAFMGDMADQAGRRPIYILMFTLLIGANIGMALQDSYAALFVLRMLQSAGSSGLTSVAYGVIADITVAGERGGFVGSMLVATDFAVSLGPVIGGVIAQESGWRWIFWFLVILTGSHFLIVLLFLPETQRNIVGDGSGKARGVYWSFFSALQKHEKEGPSTHIVKPMRHYPNPFACLPILANKQSLIVILLYSITYAVKMTLQASLGAQCVEIYQLDYLNAGLIYLPSGVSGGVGAFCTGRFLNYYYRRTVQKLSNGNGRSFNGHEPDFPIEKTRLKGAYMLILVSGLGTLGYGLALMTRTHISVMIIMQFLTGVTTASLFAMTGTLLTDLNMQRSATASAAMSIVRCLGAGAAVAAVQPLADSIGLGWCFAIYAIFLLVELPLAWLIQKNGMKWRSEQTRGESQ